MVFIEAMNLRDVDLNLLVSLRVLLEERHVTHAAEKLGITQPAMSAALARLRALFGDPLLIRGHKGLTLTARATDLLDQLASVLSDIERIVALPHDFVAAASRRTFVLIGTDFIEFVLLPRLLAAFATEAPHLQVVFRPPNPLNIEALMSAAELDLAVGYLPNAPQGLLKSVLFHEPFVCIARRDHPTLGGKALTLNQYIDLPHVQALPRDGVMYASDIDSGLSSMGLVRKVVVWQPSFLAIPSIVAATDLIATVPRRLAVHAAEALPIAVHDVPLSLPPPDISMYWHSRCQDDAGHRWLRRKVASLMKM